MPIGGGNDNSGGPRNPWGRKPGNDGRKNPWGNMGPGGSGGQGGGDIPPDLDEMLRKAQENLRKVMPNAAGPGRFGGILAVAAVGLWLASGFYFVNPGENAVITQFGKWTRTQQEPGLGYRLPWPVQAATVMNVTVDRRIQIGFNEGESRGGGATKRDIPEESLMLTSDANIVDLDLVVLWNISKAEDYLFNLRDQEQTIKKVAESAIREVVGQTRLQPITTGNRNDVAARAEKIMQQTLDSYKSGVAIKSVVIREATVHPDVIEAFEDVVAAGQDAERFQNEANIYANDILPRARGEATKMLQEAEAYKASIIAKAEGDAGRFDAIYAAYVNGKEVTKQRIYIETMENIMSNAQKIIVDDAAGATGVVPYLPLNELKPSAGDTAAPPQNPSSAAGGFDTRERE